jgi:hypothetical protein
LAYVAGEVGWRDLLLKTGMAAERLEGVLERLARLGAVEVGERVLSMAPSSEVTASPSDSLPKIQDVRPFGALERVEAIEPAGLPPLAEDPENEVPDTAPHASEPEANEPEAGYRQLYTRRFGELAPDLRVSAAAGAADSELIALCYDPDPRVISAVVDNGAFGLSHARTIARHHRNARGLEILARHSELLRDGQVQQSLLKNPQLPAGVVHRLLGPKPLREVYKLSVDRNLPDHTRTTVRSELRKKFTTAEPEERASLIVRTEGRALTLLAGCTFDGRTTQILCAQSFSSTLLVQNLARFSATPPPLLAKLIQQPTVRRQPQLRAILLRHPNMPAEVKRRM